MLSQQEILQLYADLEGRKVLSVYLNGTETDPAERRAWRVRLGHMTKELQARLADGPAEDREGVRSALQLVEDHLARYSGLLPERGWVGFATPDRLWYAGATPVPVPDLVRWEDGVHVTPYVRALKQSRPVIAILADQRRARIFRYQFGLLEQVDVVQADIGTQEFAPASSKRPATRTGMRGETGTDANRRMEEASTQRMLREVVASIPEIGEEDRLMLVAGRPEVVANILKALPERARERAMDVPAIHVDASDAVLKEAVESAASALSLRLQRLLVDRIVEAAHSNGRGCLGRERTERALQAGAVETLVLSRRLSRAEPDFADRLVDLALARSASVEEISEAAAEELDREGGVGARLRFSV